MADAVFRFRKKKDPSKVIEVRNSAAKKKRPRTDDNAGPSPKKPRVAKKSAASSSKGKVKEIVKKKPKEKAPEVKVGAKKKANVSAKKNLKNNISKKNAKDRRKSRRSMGVRIATGEDGGNDQSIPQRLEASIAPELQGGPRLHRFITVALEHDIATMKEELGPGNADLVDKIRTICDSFVEKSQSLPMCSDKPSGVPRKNSKNAELLKNKQDLEGILSRLEAEVEGWHNVQAASKVTSAPATPPESLHYLSTEDSAFLKEHCGSVELCAPDWIDRMTIQVDGIARKMMDIQRLYNSAEEVLTRNGQKVHDVSFQGVMDVGDSRKFVEGMIEKGTLSP